MNAILLLSLLLACVVVTLLLLGARVVPQRQVYVVERLGKYQGMLEAGFHLLIPVVDRVAYKHTLKEVAIDVPPQTCITKDNIQVEVDGVLFMQVVDAVRASYGIDDYRFASIQLAQTTMRSEIGRIELDRTFEERDSINRAIVTAIDKASESWGVKVTRYEVKNIVPPPSIRDAMEKQMRAEREKRAQIAESEGARQAAINKAEGERAAAIARAEGERAAKIAQSEGERQRLINEAEGESARIAQIADATAGALRAVAASLQAPGGEEALRLRVAEQYVERFGEIAKAGTTIVVPADLTDLTAVLRVASGVLGAGRGGRG
ncbi:MAG: paraslipin [Gemmatimonadetes bacterium]|nr:paraslipin [Gemmatimonadota bacterium]